MESSVNTLFSLTPDTVSPVLKTAIVIAMKEDVTATFATATTNVRLYGTNVKWRGVTTPQVITNLFVMSVDNAPASGGRTVTVKYPGAVMDADSYYLRVYTTDEGAFDSGELTLTVKGEVTEISP